MTLTTLGIALAMFATVHTPDDDTILTPLEIVKKSDHLLDSDPIHVRFRVANVDSIPVTRADGTKFNQIRLHPDTNFDPSLRGSFYVALSEPVENTIKRIGIPDLEQHFKGKSIEVGGRLSRSGLHLIRSESYWFYHVEISDLKQMQSVKP